MMNEAISNNAQSQRKTKRMLSLRISFRLMEALENLSEKTGENKSVIVERAIIAYINRERIDQ